MKTILDLLKQTFKEWMDDKGPQLGAALSYYTVFSLAPFLIVVIAIAGLAFGHEAVQSSIIDQITNLIGNEGAAAIREMVLIAQKPKVGVAATIIGLIVLIFGASGVFAALQDALNTIWEVPPPKTLSPWALIKQRFISFAMVMGVGFLLLVSLVFSAMVAYAGDFLARLLTIPEFTFQLINLVFSFAFVTVLFALILKYIPDAEIAWEDVWVGAVVTSTLFTIGKFLIGFYIAKTNVVTSFGAAGSLALLLIWVYYSAQIVFFGAEFTQVYSNTFGSRVQTLRDK